MHVRMIAQKIPNALSLLFEIVICWQKYLMVINTLINYFSMSNQF
jgi:hypothetical protein